MSITAVGVFDPGEMADQINDLYDEDWNVSVELGRESFWIVHADVVRGMLAIYAVGPDGERISDPIVLIPGSTPIYLRVVRNT